MSKSVLYSKRIEAFQLVSIPAVFVILTVVIFFITTNKVASYSVLLGGLVWLIPNLYFAYRVFSKVGTQVTPEQLIMRFYLAEVVKLSLSAIIFIAILKIYTAVAMVPLLIGYAIAQVTFWVSPFILNLGKRSSSE